MDDSLSILLEIHNSFGFPPVLVSQGLNSSKKACLFVHKQIQSCGDPAGSTTVLAGAISTTAPSERAQVDLPDFISDRGTPNSTTSSLTTPTQPLLSTFVFPPVQEYRTPDPVPPRPFLSEEKASSQISFPFHLHPPLHPPRPTWHPVPQSYANHTSLALPTTMPHNDVYGGVLANLANPTFHAEGMYHTQPNEPWLAHSEVQQTIPQDNSFVLGNVDGECHRLPKGKSKAAAIAGPKRVERSRKRQAPYRVDKDHEGAKTKNSISQQAFLSETSGYENVGHDDIAPKKSTTKRGKKKPFQLPAADHHVTGSSVGDDRSLQARTHTPTPQHITPERPASNIAASPDPKRAALTIIRRHARSKNRGFTFVNSGGDQGWT